MGNIQPIFSNNQELKEWLLNVHEKYCIELKKHRSCPIKQRSAIKILLIRMLQNIKWMKIPLLF
jgi:hypothetical protein